MAQPVRNTCRSILRKLRLAPATRRAGRNAIVASPDLLFPEARIENNTGDRSRIRIGAHTAVRGRLLTFGHGGRIEIGEWCYVGHRTEIWSAESVTIGDRVLIAHNVSIVDTTSHSSDPTQRHQHYRDLLARGLPKRVEEIPGVESAPIVIEDDVWISFGVTILRGVRIGQRSVIAAGSLVTQDVPADSVYRMQVTPVITRLED